ncbi:hypothetical protein [Thiohalorhabdus sp.]|uniref:hypothetical protein n=1 Tax=Thiohalorhabdus sp. TaxID=3094134 RepID=UPI002FC2ECBC
MPEVAERETQAERIRWVLQDQERRLNHLYWVIDPYSRERKFRMNPAQSQLYRNAGHRNIILKARQHGFSTFIAIWALDTALFNSNVNVVLVADSEDNAKEIFRTKIMFAYNRLPAALRERRQAKRSRQEELLFNNNSSIRVTTNARSGTVQFLHVSEFGKIAHYYPDKARELRTGSFETVHKGMRIFVESTAKGYSGDFYDLCKTAQQQQQEGRPQTELDWTFHFFAWFEHPDYYLPNPEEVVIPADTREYLDKLETDLGITLTEGQKAWYSKKYENLGDDIMSEHPSTPEEAFAQPVEGAYYHRQMAALRKHGRITDVPFDPRVPVYTFWDLGHNDDTCIWFMQPHGQGFRFIRYYWTHGESIQFYARKLKEFADDFGFIYGTCYLPHDAENANMEREDGKNRREILEDFNFRVRVVEKVQDKQEAHQAVRDVLPRCWFDAENCATGIMCLDHYRKEWDDRLGVYKDKPRHDWASHGNDAFEQFARGWDGGGNQQPLPNTKRGWRQI